MTCIYAIKSIVTSFWKVFLECPQTLLTSICLKIMFSHFTSCCRLFRKGKMEKFCVSWNADKHPKRKYVSYITFLFISIVTQKIECSWSYKDIQTDEFRPRIYDFKHIIDITLYEKWKVIVCKNNMCNQELKITLNITFTIYNKQIINMHILFLLSFSLKMTIILMRFIESFIYNTVQQTNAQEWR